MAAKPDRLVAADTWLHAWQITDDYGQPVDLSGVQARLHLRDKTGVKVVEASTTDGRITIDGPAGRITMEVPAADMSLPPGPYRFALELTHPGGRVQTVETHTLVVLKDETWTAP